VSFTPEKLTENTNELIQALIKLKPPTAKGTYLRGISLASSMSPGITIDTKAFIH
jgi:large subunit ribosomal protein L1